MAGEVSLGGFSGYDTQAMADALVAAQRVSVDRLQSRKAKIASAQTAWNAIGSKLGTLSSAAASLATAAAMPTMSLVSSDASKVTVSGAPRSSVSLSFGVAQLARGSTYAVGGFADSSSTLGAGTVTFARNLSAIGVSTASGQDVHAQTVEVTQSSEAAILTSSSSFPLTISPGAVLDLDVTVGQSTSSVSVPVAAGSYASASELATALEPALAGSGVTVSVSDGQLVLASQVQGSAVTLAASGSAATELGLLASSVGRDAVVVVGATETTITELSSGQEVTVASESGSLTLTVGATGGLLAGTAQVSSYSFDADSTLDDVALRINSSGSPFSAAIIGSDSSTELILASRATGTPSNVDVTWAGFSAGTVSQIRTATDAQITIGTKTLTRESNTVTDLVAGATVTLNATTGGTEVTVMSTASADRLLASARSFVSAFNDAVGTIGSATASNPGNPAQAGPLVADGSARMLRRELVAALNSVSGSGDYDRLTSIGLSMSRTGQLTLDDSALRQAATTAPESVAGLLSRTLTGAQPWAAVKSTPANLASGTYEVTVSQAASQAELTSSAFATMSAQEFITVTAGGVSVGITVPYGATPSSAVSLLNSRFAASGVAARAMVDDSSVKLVSLGYGAASTLEVSSSTSILGWSSASAVGTDVQGTIGGGAASGSGRSLTSSAGAVSGMVVEVTASAADVTAASGNLSTAVTYGAGLSAAIRSALDRVNGTAGTVSNAQASLSAGLRRLDNDIARAERLAGLAESRIRRQFAALEAAIASMRSSVPTFPSISSRDT